MNKNLNLVKQFLSYAMGSFAVLVLGFISSPIITRLISPEEYGKMSLFNMIVTVFGMVSILGLDQSYIRYYNRSGINRKQLYNSCRKFPMLFTVLVLALYLFFAREIDGMLFGEHSFLIELLVVLCVVCTVTNRFEYLYVRMRQNAKIYSTVQIVQKASYILTFVLAFVVMGDCFEVAISAIAFSMLTSTCLLVLHRLIKKENITMEESITENISEKELFLFGAPFVMNSMLSWLMISADKISIKMWTGDTAELGYYSAAATIIVLVTTLKDVFSTFYAPVALQNYEQNPNNTKFYQVFFDLITAVAFLLGTIFIMSKDVIVLLLGEKYRSASAIMPCLLFVPIMHTLSEITSQGINFKNKPILHNAIEIPVCLLNFILNFFFIPIIGARGAAVASGFCYILFFVGKSIISEKLYPVGYRCMNAGIQIICTFCYALLATLTNNSLMLVITGVALCLFLIAINLESYRKMLEKTEIKKKLKFLKRILSNDTWNVGICTDSLESVIRTERLFVHWMKHSYHDRFFADPFLFKQDEESYYILAEEYKFWKPKGIIVLLQVSKKDYRLKKRSVVITETEHLSFPFMLDENTIVPECFRSGSTNAYTLNEEGLVVNKQELLPYGTVDGVFYYENGEQYHIFSNGINALSDIYITKRVENEGWTTPSEIPVKSDIKTSRSAGRIFHWNGHTIRPVQDSERCYGACVRLMDVNEFGADLLNEKEIACLTIKNAGKYQNGFHTFNVYSNCIIVDGCSRKFQPFMNLFLLKCKKQAEWFYSKKYAP